MIMQLLGWKLLNGYHWCNGSVTVCSRNYFLLSLVNQPKAGEGGISLCPVTECGWAVCCIAVIVWMDTCQPRFRKLERSGWMPLPVQHQKSDRWLWLAVVPWLIPTINPALWCVPYSVIILVLHYIRMNHLFSSWTSNMLLNKLHSLLKTLIYV